MLNLAEMTADSQLNEQDRDDARDMIQEVAELFNIANTQVDFEETVKDNGDVVVTIKSHLNQARPKLTVVSDNTPVGSNDNDWSHKIHRLPYKSIKQRTG